MLSDLWPIKCQKFVIQTISIYLFDLFIGCYAKNFGPHGFGVGTLAS